MPIDYSESLGDIIRSKRRQCGLSLRDLAARTGVHHSTIDRIEKGLFSVVDPETLNAIGDALHLDKLFLQSLNGAGVKDEDIRIIARAARRMDADQRRRMLEMLKSSFKDAFTNVYSDDLDENGDYLDERK
ncbi:MAG: helix-turn-helix domain-containing protein [Clostridia bacterium]|nr:helix-turn-helix domain-containing protein [Clostridia bacterium]